ncbi:extensin family protein [Erythrobacter sp. JK5]|uniref:extensin family protein n=1 Tax=Erythrobacter sp. JK5 TaxID=2829500 RepID=UPI001BAC1D38|nr:extensin family protein [Erythrobacter sp. JK5]QUL38211.1 extensin family protein [Erythrobacter sp. JK5]
MTFTATPKAIPLLASALALAGCGSLIPASNGGPAAGQAAGSTSASSRPPARVASTPQRVSNRAGDVTCFAELNAAGASFDALPDAYSAPGCSTLGTVQLSALAGDASRFGISNIGPVTCRAATTFNGWLRFGVDRAAREILGSPLARVETMGSYACRNVAGSERRSAHARAEAIDVSAFVLENGRRIALAEDWDNGSAAEREFLRVVHRSACKRFGTVLGPEYNAAHRDHFHLEESSGQFCR